MSDIERALAFYERLGFTLINEGGWRRGQRQVSIKIGENQKINIHKQDVVGSQTSRQDTGPNDKFNLAYIPLAGDADFCLVWGGTIREAQQHLRDSGADHVSPPRNVTGARGPVTSVYFRDRTATSGSSLSTRNETGVSTIPLGVSPKRWILRRHRWPSIGFGQSKVDAGQIFGYLADAARTCFMLRFPP